MDTMNLKKITIGILFLVLLSGCAQNTALLGPAYTLVTSGNLYNAGLSYGGDKIIAKTTGKSAVENVKDALTPKKNDTDFQKLVKKNIKKTRKKLKIIK
jgi:hypothetical protein